MSRVLGEQDFHGGFYDEYRRYPFFRRRAELLDERYGEEFRDSTVWVAGCGWGFLVDELRRLDWSDVWGFDLSEYAVEMAEAELPEEAAERVVGGGQVVYGDALDPGDMEDLAERTGAPSMIVTEDLLTAADSKAEAREMAETLRGVLADGGEMVHVVTPRRKHTSQVEEGALWLWREEWAEMLPEDAVVATGLWYEVLNR